MIPPKRDQFAGKLLVYKVAGRGATRGGAQFRKPGSGRAGKPAIATIIPVPAKKFYIETFGCQMNAHDSEKVIGTLLTEGYEQVETPDSADLVLYNTCSIRDKAEQKVFHRLDQYKRNGKEKLFGVLGCVAQQEGEKIFAKAPHVSLVCGSASYT